jgi:MerR family transcriptional regulator, thiopeptide resistance regulator
VFKAKLEHLEEGVAMTEQVSIGHFSAQTGLSVRALRLYDQVGLLKPALVTTHNHYRYYQPEQIKIAQQIKLYRQYDLPLEDIKTILENPRQTQKTLQNHLERLQQGVAKQQSLIGQLENFLQNG